MPSGRKRFRYRMEWLALQAASKIVPLFPRIACYYFAQFLGWWIFLWRPPGRRVAFSNLEAAFGDQVRTGNGRVLPGSHSRIWRVP